VELIAETIVVWFTFVAKTLSVNWEKIIVSENIGFGGFIINSSDGIVTFYVDTRCITEPLVEGGGAGDATFAIPD
jgi:hypothetical protein